MPQVIVKRSELPPVSKNGTYTVRVRVISEDRNSSSYWTPVYTLLLPVGPDGVVATARQATVYHDPIGQSLPQNYNIYVSWADPDSLGAYDIYTKWHNSFGWSEWIYLDTVFTKNFAFNPPLHLTTPGDPSSYFDKYGVAVTRPNYQKEYVSDLALFSTDTMATGGIDL